MNDNVQEAMDNLMAAVKLSVLESVQKSLLGGGTRTHSSRSSRRTSGSVRVVGPTHVMEFPNVELVDVGTEITGRRPRRKPARRNKWQPGSRGRVPASATAAQRKQHLQMIGKAAK